MKASEIQPRKLVVFDIDDTLVHTQTKVHVIKDGEVVDSLNSHDFTHYRLKPGEEFDFGDFRNAREFFEKSKPIIPMMNQLKRDIATGNKVVMVTARADFDDRELFLDTFRKFGIDMGKVHVYRAGNSKEGTTEERKKAIIKRLLDSGNFTKAIMYDDAKPNLHLFMELKKDHPQTKFYAWHVSLEGEASEYMRESMAEGDKMSLINLDQSLANTPPVWKKFISSLPSQLAREFVDERPRPDQDDIDFLTPLRLASSQPVAVRVADLLRHPENQATIGRSPDDVVTAVNQRWGLKIPSGKKYDPNPARYQAYARMAPGTASPSVMADGVILFGAGRFVAAALRGDETMRVWSMTRKQGVAEGYTTEKQILTRIRQIMYDRKLSGSESNAGELLRLKQQLKDLRSQQGMAENFADGKKKGKSRPGRVKRAGASCKGSVTDLRKRAKNSSGEKQKMLHWCANMKSGRNK